jgi:predicted RNase H-like nuclease (RuvC/YqgF family)
MPDETKSEPVPSIPTPEGGVNEAQLDPIGQNILDALHKATGLARWNSRYAVDIAQKLSDQLCAAENRITELESQIEKLQAECQFYRDKSERAESWLSKISGEIQEQVTKSQN